VTLATGVSWFAAPLVVGRVVREPDDGPIRQSTKSPAPRVTRNTTSPNRMRLTGALLGAGTPAGGPNPDCSNGAGGGRSPELPVPDSGNG
jgi:hypothetical protein